MTPETAFFRLAASLLLGAALGLLYGFLRPLGRRHRHLADALVVLGAWWAYIYLGFGVCAGDLRLGYVWGLLAGAVVWEATAGRWLQPVFSGIWQILGVMWGLFWAPGKKFLQFTKILFASGEKWVTIR